MSAQQEGPLTHLQLIPAESVTANYDNEAGILLLKASGKQVDFTRDIHFFRKPFSGGLLFDLQGQVGPVILRESLYEVTNGFNIALPSPTNPSNNVVIDTEGKRWVIPIHYNNESSQQAQATNGKAQSDLPETKEIPGDDKIVVYDQTPFIISQIDSFSGKGGSINVDFDRTYVELINAGITEGKIEWTFNALLSGNTEVVVYVGQENPSFVYRIVYDVRIILPGPGESAAPRTKVSFSVNSVSKANGSTNGSAAKGLQKGADKVGLPLSWDGFINVGINLIKKKYTDAKLLEVDARPLTRKPVDNEWGLVNNRIVCGLSGNKTAIIESKGWGEFGQVQTINSPFLGDVVISWPVPLDIHDAFSILRKGGYKQGVSAVTLRQPLYPGDDQPFYIFSIGNEFIAVGVNDKKIHDFGVQQHMVQKA
ncbi:hypothetical protein F53441_6450 [Fusarium austroafricanum]|uniref:Uncharacterized protein n=1 Tax=Fusarium austroafricanum TaxID=2364996 RepID=A0A8H4NZK2_9HYPO|nr:hypothetical protein F53441_6450 [Fusarium austroafricanum]